MVEIIVKISDRDDSSIDVQIRGTMVAPYSGYEQQVAKEIIPRLNELIVWVKDNFQAQKLNIVQLDGPLNPPKPKPEEPWRFPGRE